MIHSLHTGPEWSGYNKVQILSALQRSHCMQDPFLILQALCRAWASALIACHSAALSQASVTPVFFPSTQSLTCLAASFLSWKCPAPQWTWPSKSPFKCHSYHCPPERLSLITLTKAASLLVSFIPRPRAKRPALGLPVEGAPVVILPVTAHWAKGTGILRPWVSSSRLCPGYLEPCNSLPKWPKFISRICGPLP